MGTGRCLALLLAGLPAALWPAPAVSSEGFYVPDGLRQGPPGALLKAEPVASPGAGAAYRITDRSRDHAGR